MIPIVRNKISEYRQRFIKQSGYVVEVGSYDPTGGVRACFPDALDFCGIDWRRGPGVDIVYPLEDVDRLFDFEPDTIIYNRELPPDRRITCHLKAVRKMLSPAGFLIIVIPNTGSGSYADFLFNGYNVLDLSFLERTICGIAQKPSTISYDFEIH